MHGAHDVDRRRQLEPSRVHRAHQQYLAKNPAGYCGIGDTGVTCPVGFAEAVEEASASAGESKD
jgi:hypothetical protein